MRRLPPFVLLFALSAHAVGQTNMQTLAEQQQAVAAQQQAIQSMQGMTLEQQQAFAKNWATQHHVAFVATAVKNGDGVDRAYAFRGHMSGDAQCQNYAQQADQIYVSSTLSQSDKQQQLAQIARQAGAANCTQ